MKGLAEFQARQSVRRLHGLRSQVDLFTSHAKMLRQASASIDGAFLLKEADNLLRGLMASQDEFRNVNANLRSLTRSLSSRPPVHGGPAPAAQWGNEFRAGSKQFMIAVQNAEKEIGRLYGTANAQVNSPTRIATAPDNLIDVLMVFIDVLTHWIESRRRDKH